MRAPEAGGSAKLLSSSEFLNSGSSEILRKSPQRFRQFPQLKDYLNVGMGSAMQIN